MTLPADLLDNKPKACFFCGDTEITYGVRDGYMVVIYKPACSRCAADLVMLSKIKEIVDALAVWKQRFVDA